MPSDSRNLTLAKATGLIFCCSTSFQPERCLLPCCYTYNKLCPPLCPIPTKGVNFVVGTWWLPIQTEIFCNFHRPRFSTLFTPLQCWSLLDHRAYITYISQNNDNYFRDACYVSVQDDIISNDFGVKLSVLL